MKCHRCYGDFDRFTPQHIQSTTVAKTTAHLTPEKLKTSRVSLFLWQVTLADRCKFGNTRVQLGNEWLSPECYKNVFFICVCERSADIYHNLSQDWEILRCCTTKSPRLRKQQCWDNTYSTVDPPHSYLRSDLGRFVKIGQVTLRSESETQWAPTF